MERKEAKRNNNEGEEDSSEDEEKIEKVKQLKLCHCPKFVVTDGMMAAMASGQPSQKYKADITGWKVQECCSQIQEWYEDRAEKI